MLREWRSSIKSSQTKNILPYKVVFHRQRTGKNQTKTVATNQTPPSVVKSSQAPMMQRQERAKQT